MFVCDWDLRRIFFFRNVMINFFLFLLCSSSTQCIKYFPFLIDFNIWSLALKVIKGYIYYSQVASTSILVVIWPDKRKSKHSILIFQEGRSTDHHLTSFFSVYCRSISKTCQRQGNLSVIFLIHAVKQWDFFKLQYVAAQTNCWPTQLNGPHLQLRHYLTSLGNCTDDMLLGQYNGPVVLWL